VTLKNGSRIWIEAVAPNTGEGNDRVPELKEDCVSDLPKDECLLRLAQGIKAKKDKFESYRSKGVVNPNDACIIAVSSCALNQFGSLLDYPCPAPISVLSGANKMVLSKNKPPCVSKRQMIPKSSGSPVDVCVFDDPSYDMISAVLYSSEDPLNAPPNPELSFQMFLNPRAIIPIPENFLNNITCWHSEKYGDGVEWRRL